MATHSNSGRASKGGEVLSGDPTDNTGEDGLFLSLMVIRKLRMSCRDSSRLFPSEAVIYHEY